MDIFYERVIDPIRKKKKRTCTKNIENIFRRTHESYIIDLNECVFVFSKMA